MTKKEFVAKFSEKIGASKAESDRILAVFLETTEEVLCSGDNIKFTGWGSFEVNETKARMGRNPKTGESIEIPSKKVVKFKAGKLLSENVNK